MEPEILHYPAVALPMDLARAQPGTVLAAAVLGTGRRLHVTIQGNGRGQEGAQVTLFSRGINDRRGQRKGRTSANG